ncbi:MAG: phosphoribosylformylglycinamidine synthase subunit PurS [Elusimicrobia bacterium]|nr:phosphoribosylformylglycinamidine synthase subunit PurS [Elusimicrobiota bacterium]
MIIEVFTKDKYAKNEQAGLIKKLAAAGFKTDFLRFSKLYRLDGNYSKAAAKKLAGELLCDTITESWSFTPRRFTGRNIYSVEIWLKDSVTDVVGESVRSAVTDMGFDKPAMARFGKSLYARAASATKLRHAVAKTLANETVNYCTVTKVGASDLL